MGTWSLVWLLSWLMNSCVGRLVLFAAALWYLDDRYLGLAAALWAPVVRARRVSALRRAIEINPSDVTAMVELGEHHLRGGRHRQAAQFLEMAEERGEAGARTRYLLGAAWVRMGRHGDGRARLESAVEQAPKVGYGEPFLYLLEEALATDGPQSPRAQELVSRLDEFDSVEVLTRAGRLCAAAGRTDLGRRLLTAALHNYGYTPKAMRRRERRWMVRARLGLLGIGGS